MVSPECYSVADSRLGIELIKDLVGNNNLKYSEICIASRTNYLLKPIEDAFYNEHIPYVHVSGAASQNGKDRIALSTFHNAKGLEYKVMILASVNSDLVPVRPQAFEGWDEVKKRYYLKSEAALLYVAMTRAIQELILTGTGDKCELVKI